MKSTRLVLTVDIGNSSTKFSLFENDVLRSGQSCSNNEWKQSLSAIFNNFKPDGVILSNSGNIPEALLENLMCLTDGNLMALTPDTLLPVEFGSYDMGTLGKDRIAGACGASALYPRKSLFIADVGTALTLDVLRNGKTFIGGNISPGLALRFKSLHEATAALPLVENWENVSMWGNDTFSAIRDGVVNGVIYEIYISALLAKKMEGCELTILTGGNADFIKRLLASFVKENELDNIGEIVCCPDLVARGLLRIYNLNENN